jgi:hypothetical protein
MKLATLFALGFDESAHVPFTKQFKVRCSQCEALVINGVPCHETGCPHATHECAGCSNIIPERQKYCEDCI